MIITSTHKHLFMKSQYYNTTILQYYKTTILQYYNTTILQYYNTTILQYYNATISIASTTVNSLSTGIATMEWNGVTSI
jgi:hypothetical protein